MVGEGDIYKFMTWLGKLTGSRTEFPYAEHLHENRTTYRGMVTLYGDMAIVHDQRPWNHIEARIVHKPTGVYTDITTLFRTSNATVLNYKRGVVSRPRKLESNMFAMKVSPNQLSLPSDPPG